MNAITIWNKGKRTWPLKNSEGVEVRLEPQESCQVEEVYGLRMVAAYPKDLTTTGVAGPSIDDIKRREQSLRDREANLDAREKALDEREKALKEPAPTKEELLKEAEALGLKLDPAMSVKKIKAAIAEKKAEPPKAE